MQESFIHITTSETEKSTLKHTRFQLLVLTIFLGVVSVLPESSAQDRIPKSKQTDSTSARSITFQDDIAPILNIHCVKCHGGKVKKAGLDLRRRFAMLKGGDSGPSIVAGDPDSSLILEMITTEQMPPEKEGRVGAKQIDILKRWIAAGAPIKGRSEAPLDESVEEVEVTEEDRSYWAFKPPQRPAIPKVKANHRVRTPVDAFLLAKLEAKQASFNPDASKRVLIRRAYFDLLGLPPNPKEIEQFLTDTNKDSYERMVDRLLASTRYGERWGRHWLDLAGYADSDGYLAADRLRPEAWRYRDYVIRAHNEDKPIDRFILEQVAGDELSDWRRSKDLSPEVTDNLIATGFLRTALDPTYGGYAEPLECHKVMADTMQIVSSTFLGLTIQCARCHAHKFDPISQKDYYRLHAIFLASYNPNRWKVSIQRSIPLATEAEQKRLTKKNQLIDARLKQLNQEIAETLSRFREKYLDKRLAQLTEESIREQVKAALLVDPKKRNKQQKEIVAKHAAKVSTAEKELLVQYPVLKTHLDKLRQAVAAESVLKTPVVQLRGLQDLDGQADQAHILIRGDFTKPGATVEPGPPKVLIPQDYKFKIEPGYKTTGRRKALAHWLVDPANPLTARVFVNRVWARHFGHGIVSTLDDFGSTGSAPSHPKLLDWLAVEFASGGWSLKDLHRLLLKSTAYRQSSQPNPQSNKVDPENVLLGSWRPRRHEGEVVRDSILAITGKLNRKMFGPPIPVSRGGDGQVTVADTPEGNRASIYVIVRRSQPVTILEMFDTPTMEINCPQRTESIVVTQSLTMLNSKFAENNAAALADRLLSEAPNRELARIDLAHQLLFARLPTADERQTITQFIDEVVRLGLGTKVDTATSEERNRAHRVAWNQLALVLLNSNEFLFVQ